MSLTIYAANRILDHLIGKTAFPLPTIHVALCTANPTAAATNTETTYPGYARVATPAGSWTVAAAAASDSTAQVTFGINTGPQVTLTHWATFDAAAGGNMIEFGALTPPKVLDTNDAPFIIAGSFDRTAA